MARTRNGSLSGTMDYDVDVDAPVFQRVVQEAVQDLHMLYDAATGENNPGVSPVIQTIDHSGADGAGSLLGIPPFQQYIGALAGMTGPDAATYAPNDDDYNIILLAKPIWICAGESDLLLEVDGVESDQLLRAELYNTSWALVDALPMSPGSRSHSAFFTGLTTDVQRYVVIRWRLTLSDIGTRIVGWRAHCARGAPTAAVPFGSNGTPYPITTPGTSAPIAWERIDDAMLADDYALPGHITTLLNRMISGLWEWATGAPLPGNQALQQADYGGTTNTLADDEVTAPTTSRFKGGSRRGFASEPMPAFPLFGEAFGAFGWDGDDDSWALVDTSDPPAAGMVEWFAPYVKATAETWLRTSYVVLPDFPSGSPNALQCTILAVCEFTSGAPKGTPTNWSARIHTAGGYSSSVAFSQIGTSPFYKATVTDIPFTSDALQTVTLLVDTSGTYLFGELSFLGWDFTFVP